MSFKILAVVILTVTKSLADQDLMIDDRCATQEKCVDAKLGEILERFDTEERIPLFGGLEIVKTPLQEPVNIERSESNDIVGKIKRFANTHNFQFKTMDEDDFEDDDEEARTGRLKKLMLPLILALKVKMALVLPVVLSAIALIAIKGVFAGLFAILLSGLTALKSFSDAKQDRVTAFVATPEMIHHHPWNRAGASQEALQASQVQQLQAIDPYATYQALNQYATAGLPKQ